MVHRICTYTVRADFDSEALKLWSNIKSEFCETLECITENSGVKWLEVNLFRRGYCLPLGDFLLVATEDDDPLYPKDFYLEADLTVVISSPDADNKFWTGQDLKVLRSVLPPQFRLEVVHNKGGSWHIDSYSDEDEEC